MACIQGSNVLFDMTPSEQRQAQAPAAIIVRELIACGAHEQKKWSLSQTMNIVDKQGHHHYHRHHHEATHRSHPSISSAYMEIFQRAMYALVVVLKPIERLFLSFVFPERRRIHH